MFTTGSKLLLGATVMATIAAVAYGLAQGGALGTVGLTFAALALALLAGVNLYVRDADVSAMDAAAVAASPAAATAPGASVWPAVAALGAALVVIGVASFPVVVIFGVIALVAATVEWMVQAWSERASADGGYNAGVRSRIAHPLEFPLFAIVGIGILVYSFSRIMLFLSKSAGPVAFGLIAALILGAGFVVALRPAIKTGAVAVVAVVAALGLVAGGVSAALDGERDIHVYETTSDLARANECDTTEETEADENASQTVAAKANITAEVTLREDEALVARNLGIAGDQSTVVVARNNPTNVLFRNETSEPRRMVLQLGSNGATLSNPDRAGVPTQRCTSLVEEGGSQLLTFSIAMPSAAREQPYLFTVPGVDDTQIEVVVP
ncbi:MAG: hypothetical protein M3487_05040 [Actinomycetota bacterium]|nr:hypothetical protein [Acidimicrobiia bacterium]MDQ3469116.1 hypothetical protein [Actinomycetota bacterium]